MRRRRSRHSAQNIGKAAYLIPIRSGCERHARHPRLATEHVAPAIKHELIPRHGSILARNTRTAEGSGVFAAPGNDRIGYTIMKYCRLRRIEILHWMKGGWRLSAWHTMINPPHHTKLQPPAPG